MMLAKTTLLALLLLACNLNFAHATNLRSSSPRDLQAWDFGGIDSDRRQGVSTGGMTFSLGPERLAASWQQWDPKLAEYSPERNAQRLALVTFYYATGGNLFWYNKTDWLSYEVDECMWFSKAGYRNGNETLFNGTETLNNMTASSCDENGSYKVLDLHDNGLTGSLPANITGLANLTEMILSNNQLTGGLTAELMSLPSLYKLDLDNNTNFADSIPTEIGLSSTLTYLVLTGNALSSSIPSEMGNAKNLRDILLENNMLTGTIPPELANITGYPLVVPGNATVQYEGPGDVTVSIERQGGLLDTTGVFDTTGGLERLHLSGNMGINGTIPLELAALPSLASLTFNNTGVSGGLRNEFCTMSSLRLECSDTVCGCDCVCPPSPAPTFAPTPQPTTPPTKKPTGAPTKRPTGRPTRRPTRSPTRRPTRAPTRRPTRAPTRRPTPQPTQQGQPTNPPTKTPTKAPTPVPSKAPSNMPTGLPSGMPSNIPSGTPSVLPSHSPSTMPTSMPSTMPTTMPSATPTDRPSASPTAQPSATPTTQPSAMPTLLPRTIYEFGVAQFFFDTEATTEEPSFEEKGLMTKATEQLIRERMEIAFAGNFAQYTFIFAGDQWADDELGKNFFVYFSGIYEFNDAAPSVDEITPAINDQAYLEAFWPTFLGNNLADPTNPGQLANVLGAGYFGELKYTPPEF